MKIVPDSLSVRTWSAAAALVACLDPSMLRASVTVDGSAGSGEGYATQHVQIQDSGTHPIHSRTSAPSKWGTNFTCFLPEGQTTAP